MGNTDSKVAFRQAVFRLQGTDPLPPTGSTDRDAFFAQFWSIPTSADDVFTLLTPADIKRMRDSRPDAFTALFLAVFKQFVTLATDPSWSVPTASLVASLASKAGLASPGGVGVAGSGSAAEGNRAMHMLNCIRLLTRLIPFIFELAAVLDSSPVAALLDELIAPAARATSPAAAAAAASGASDKSQGTPLGHVLVFTVVQLMFRPGFTVPSHIPIAPPDDPNVDVNDQLSWDVCQLVGQPIASPASARMASVTSPSIKMSPTCNQPDSHRPSSAVSGHQQSSGGGTPANMSSNRIEVLRLLLVCLSRSMYLPPPDLGTSSTSASTPAASSANSPTSTSPTAGPRSPTPSSPATTPTSPAPQPTTPVVAASSSSYSEMHRNPILAYLTRRASTSPIASVTPTSASTRLPSAWAQLLVRSLLYAISSYTPSSTWVPYDYLLLPASDASTLAMLATHVLCILTTAGSTLAPQGSENRVIGMLAGMSEDSARILCRALVKLLAARRKGSGGAAPAGEAGQQLLPGSAPAVVWFHEVLVLLYVLVQASEAVCTEVDGDELGDEVVGEIVGVLGEYQGQHEMNLLRISTHLLTSLTLKSTSHAELLTATIHSLLTQPSPHLAPLFPSLLHILRRLIYHHAPTHAAAQNLVQLAAVLGQPRYIANGQNNWKLAVAVFELIEYALCVHESREVLDWCVVYRAELGAFVWCPLESVEPRVVGKGKGKRKGEGWVPDSAWYENWRAHVVLPHIEHVLTSSTPPAYAPLSSSSTSTDPSFKLKSLDTLVAELSTFHKDPPPAIAAAVFDDNDDGPASAGGAGAMATGVVALLPGFVWGAVYVRHRPGEGRVGVWAGTTPRVFKVQVVGAAAGAGEGAGASARPVVAARRASVQATNGASGAGS